MVFCALSEARGMVIIMKQHFIEAGEIVNTHGIKGEVSIVPWTDSAEFLKRFKALYIDGARAEIESSRVHKTQLLCKFKGVDNVNDAMRLKGKTAFFDRDDARLPKGGYFLCDIMGARVVTDTGEDIGVLEDILEYPASNVYVVKGGSEHLIPATPEFILGADIDAGVVTVHLIEGM